MGKCYVDDSLVIAVADVAGRWAAFKRGHDIESLMMKCCEVSAEFFDSLEHLQQVISQEVKRLEKEQRRL